MESMALETIFDHDVTEEELKILLPIPLSKKEYLRLPMDADSEFGRIYSLYSLRNDTKAAMKYLAKIKDESYKFNVSLVDTIDS